MRITVNRIAYLGDVIWTEPLIRYLLQEGHEVNLITHFPSVFDHYPSSKLKINDLHFDDYMDRIINLDSAYESRPQKQILEAYRIAAKLPKMPLSNPILHLSPEEKKRKIGPRYAVLHNDPVRQHFRNIYGVDWKEIESYLASKGLKLIEISKTGRDLSAEWFPTPTIRDLMSLIYHADLFLGLDSGPSHIAAALNVPSLIFFGSVNPSLIHLNNHNKIFLQSPCPYAGCYHRSIRTRTCRLVPPNQPPQCAIHTTDRVKKAIDQIV